MNYGLVEEEISQRINYKFNELDLCEKFFAAPMPDTEKEAKDFERQIQKTRVAVEYIDSDFSANSGMGAVRQEETAKFRLLFDGRKMRGEDGLFSMMDYVKKFIVGFAPSNGDAFTISAFGKLHFEPGVWMPYLDVETKTMNVQTEAFEPATGGSFKSIL